MRSRRASAAVGALICVWPFLVAMGGGGTPSSDTIPRPQQKYSAELVDRQGVSMRLTYLSCAGKTFLPLERGEGTLLVPFDKVMRIKFGADKGANVDVTVQVEGGKALDGRLPRTLLCTGVTEFGNYQIELRGLKELVLLR